MEFDIHGISLEREGKRLRIEFTDGEVCEGKLIHLATCNEHASCCGIIFDMLATNQPEKHKRAFERSSHPAIWSEIEFVRNFEVIGD
jgi:hypothetical protein